MPETESRLHTCSHQPLSACFESVGTLLLPRSDLDMFMMVVILWIATRVFLTHSDAQPRRVALSFWSADIDKAEEPWSSRRSWQQKFSSPGRHCTTMKGAIQTRSSAPRRVIFCPIEGCRLHLARTAVSRSAG